MTSLFTFAHASVFCHLSVRSARVAAVVSLVGAALGPSSALGAQAAAPATPAVATPALPPTTGRTTRLPFDWRNAAIDGSIPFDAPFMLVMTADPTLLKLDVWYGLSLMLPLAQCSRQGAVPSGSGVNRVGWSRVDDNRKDAHQVLLPVRALPPNEDVTFCAHSVSRVSADDSTSFQRVLSGNLRRAVRNLIGSTAAGLPPVPVVLDAATVDSFHKAIRGALPRRDSVIVPRGSSFRTIAEDSAAILGDLPKDKNDIDKLAELIRQATAAGHTIQPANPAHGTLQQLQTLARNIAVDSMRIRVTTSLVGYLNADYARIGAANTLDLPATSAKPRTGLVMTLAAQIAGLGSDAHAAVREAVIASLGLKNVPELVKARLASAAGAAIALGNIGPARADAVAVGKATLAAPRIATDQVTTFTATATDVTTWAANVELTRTQLEDLRFAVVWLVDNPIAKPIKPPQAVVLGTFAAAVDAVTFEIAGVVSQLRMMTESFSRMDAAIAQAAETITTRDLMRVGIFASTGDVYKARARWYISQDLGLLYAFQRGTLHEATPYFGANFYFTPVNKDAPLSLCIHERRCLLQRLSVTLGVSTNKVDEKDRFTGPVNGNALYAALGIRLADFFRITYGAPLIYTYTPDTLRHRRLTAVHGLGASIDFELKDLISNVVTALTGK